jgi:predicted esterase
VLYHVEQFLLDAQERRGEGAGEILLVGDEQGAVLALAMALVRPELLSGVVALRGCLPVVDGWEPAPLPLDGLPVLLASDPDDPAVPEDRLAATEVALAAAGARVSRVTAPLGTPSAEGRILRAWSETER